MVGEPSFELADGRGGEAHEELREVALRIDGVAAAGGGEAGEDGGGVAGAFVADEQRVLAVVALLERGVDSEERGVDFEEREDDFEERAIAPRSGPPPTRVPLTPNRSPWHSFPQSCEPLSIAPRPRDAPSRGTYIWIAPCEDIRSTASGNSLEFTAHVRRAVPPLSKSHAHFIAWSRLRVVRHPLHALEIDAVQQHRQLARPQLHGLRLADYARELEDADF